jgi:hypothetical protein
MELSPIFEQALYIRPNWIVFLPEDGDKIHSPKRCALNKNRTMYNVQKHNNHINVLPHKILDLILWIFSGSI